MKDMTNCDKCNKFVNINKIRRLKDSWVCFNCSRKEINIIKGTGNKFIEPLVIRKRFWFSLTKSQNEFFENRVKELNMYKSEYIRELILNDMEFSENE